MRLGIFGGTFDPVHYGHLLLAECCREQCRLDQVWFMPAAIPPHKQERAMTPAQARVEMLELATGGQPAFRVMRHEIERGGVSYTVDTLQQIATEQASAKEGPAELFFLMGADSLFDLPGWRQPERICELAVPVIVRRAGGPDPDLAILAQLVTAARMRQVIAHQVEMPLVGFSSAELRARIAAGESIRFRTPAAVEQYIAQHKLYQA